MCLTDTLFHDYSCTASYFLVKLKQHELMVKALQRILFLIENIQVIDPFGQQVGKSYQQLVYCRGVSH